MLVVVEGIKQAYTVFLVVRVALVKAGDNISLAQSRLVHDLELVADNFDGDEVLFSTYRILGFEGIDCFDDAGENTLAS